jgi:hypothetical protein
MDMEATALAAMPGDGLNKPGDAIGSLISTTCLSVALISLHSPEEEEDDDDDDDEDRDDDDAADRYGEGEEQGLAMEIGCLSWWEQASALASAAAAMEACSAS